MPTGSLLVQVRTKLALHVRRRARSPLPGEHASIHKGRSMDFDDLREYQRGDEVRDIDWKSTARTGSVRLKRYVADRKHHALLVVDTGRSMSASARDGGSKRDLTVLVSGALGSVLNDQGDLVGLIAGDAAGRALAPWRSGDRHLEQVLRSIHARLGTARADSDLAGLLREVRDRHRRRMVLVVVTDEAGWNDDTAEVVRRLRAQHEIVWITILDLDPCDPVWGDREIVDATGGDRLLAAFRHDPEVRAEHAAVRRELERARREGLSTLGVVADEVTGESDAIPAVLRLIERSRRRASA